MNKPESFNSILNLIETSRLPPKEVLEKELNQAIESILKTPINIRPQSINNYPGGLLNLPLGKPVILVPDLHGRYDFLINVLQYNIDENLIFDDLNENKINILCLGDAMHTEIKTEQRWRKAYNEYLDGFKEDKEMRSEMIQNIISLRIILYLLKNYANNFFFLKGNHENILNDNKNGNHQFGKFVFEGEMVNSWMKIHYGEEIINLIFKLEKLYPILAVSNNFMASHSEPAEFYSKEDVINYNTNSKVIEGLTWTQKGDLMSGAVEAMKREYLPNSEYPTFYFAGHRAIKGKFNLRKKDGFVQIHNPARQNIGVIKSDREIDINTVIFTLD